MRCAYSPSVSAQAERTSPVCAGQSRTSQRISDLLSRDRGTSHASDCLSRVSSSEVCACESVGGRCTSDPPKGEEDETARAASDHKHSPRIRSVALSSLEQRPRAFGREDAVRIHRFKPHRDLKTTALSSTAAQYQRRIAALRRLRRLVSVRRARSIRARASRDHRSVCACSRVDSCALIVAAQDSWSVSTQSANVMLSAMSSRCFFAIVASTCACKCPTSCSIRSTASNCCRSWSVCAHCNHTSPPTHM